MSIKISFTVLTHDKLIYGNKASNNSGHIFVQAVWFVKQTLSVKINMKNTSGAAIRGISPKNKYTVAVHLCVTKHKNPFSTVCAT